MFLLANEASPSPGVNVPGDFEYSINLFNIPHRLNSVFSSHLRSSTSMLLQQPFQHSPSEIPARVSFTCFAVSWCPFHFLLSGCMPAHSSLVNVPNQLVNKSEGSMTWLLSQKVWSMPQGPQTVNFSSSLVRPPPVANLPTTYKRCLNVSMLYTDIDQPLQSSSSQALCSSSGHSFVVPGKLVHSKDSIPFYHSPCTTRMFESTKLTIHSPLSSSVCQATRFHRWYKGFELWSDIWRPRRFSTFIMAASMFQNRFPTFLGLHLSSLIPWFQVSIDSPDLAGKTQSSFAAILSPFQWYINVRKIQLEHLCDVDPLKSSFTLLWLQVLMSSGSR